MENLHLIAGLGNPGREYAQTRHNAGFLVVERFADRFKAQWQREDQFQARLARLTVPEGQVLLLEPLTFMNSSGVAVQKVAAFYRVALSRMLVIVDDADLGLGEIRMRPDGRSGGHHGLESVEQHLGTRAYARLRIGIGRREDGVREITNHVLGRFAASDRTLLEIVLDQACNQIESWLKAGVRGAMNRFNGKVNSPLVKES